MVGFWLVTVFVDRTTVEDCLGVLMRNGVARRDELKRRSLGK